MADIIEILTTDRTCDTEAHQLADVCAQVTVTPFVRTGDTVTRCCGDPMVVGGRTACNGTRNGSCTFTVRQRICVEVPIEFSAVATVGDTFVTCRGATGEDFCDDCDDSNEEL